MINMLINQLIIVWCFICMTPRKKSNESLLRRKQPEVDVGNSFHINIVIDYNRFQGTPNAKYLHGFHI